MYLDRGLLGPFAGRKHSWKILSPKGFAPISPPTSVLTPTTRTHTHTHTYTHTHTPFVLSLDSKKITRSKNMARKL